MDAQLNYLTAMWLEKPTKKQIPLNVPEEDQIFNFHCDQNSVNIVKKSLFTIGKYFAVRCGKAQYELRVIDYSWGWDPQLKKKKILRYQRAADQDLHMWAERQKRTETSTSFLIWARTARTKLYTTYASRTARTIARWNACTSRRAQPQEILWLLQTGVGLSHTMSDRQGDVQGVGRRV